ncbi:MAG TPA: UpxY family transcription antiterminator [Nitrospirota bacterium]|nr:UpxY family transcription antiterminator [Nitrospirota bacterium]
MDQLAVVHESTISETMVQDRSAIATNPNWYAVYVKSRHEFVAFCELQRKGVEAFLPLVKRISHWKDRRKLIEYPIFPGYVFVQVPPYPGAFLDVLKTRGVVAFIALEPGKPTPAAPEEIASLRLLIESGKDIDIYPHFKEGTRIRVKNGPLKYAEGVLTKRENEYLFVVNIELLGRSVAVKVSVHDIESV